MAARLRYSAITSLDGYVADARGGFDWAAPTEEVHRLVNERERDVGTYIYGRRMFEVMAPWALPDDAADESAVVAEYRRIWQAADKVVASSRLTEVTTPRTRLVDGVDADLVRSVLDGASADVSIGGPTVAAVALRAGLVDEVSLFVNPVSVGGGLPALPRDTMLTLRLVEEERVGDVVFLRYLTREGDR